MWITTRRKEMEKKPLLSSANADMMQSLIDEVEPENIELDNEKFIKISTEDMSEILQFMKNNKQYAYQEWAVVGQMCPPEDGLSSSSELQYEELPTNQEEIENDQTEGPEEVCT